MISRWSYLFLLAGIIGGQLVRLPISADSGIAFRLADGIVGVLALGWILWAAICFLGKRQTAFGSLKLADWLVLAFQVILVATFLLNLGRFNSAELVVGGAYLLRLQAYLMVYWVARTWSRTLPVATMVRYFIWSALIVAVVGLVQWLTFGDLQFMLELGWDPHVGRLVSTFFDPNFVAIFLGVGLILTISEALFGQPAVRRWHFIIAVILLVALYLTYSRGGVLSTAVAAAALGFRHSWKAGLITTAIFAAVIFSPGRLGSRFESAFSGTNIGSNGQTVTGVFTTDETGNQRLLSWQRAWKVISSSPLYGVGYNNFGPATAQVGALRKESDRAAASAQSSDSSLLNVWATSGIIGLLAILGLGLRLVWPSFFLARSSLSNPTNAWIYGYGIALVALFLDSFLVNSLFYPPLLIFWLLFGGYLVSLQTSPSQ